MLGAGFWLVLAASTTGLPAADASSRLEESKLAAWQVVDIILPKLAPGGQPDAEPGLRAFVDDVRKARVEAARNLPTGKAPRFDVEALVTHNPSFWRAQYEVAPGDPAWLLLHGGLLLAAGEATRAQAVLALARQRNDLPGPIRLAVNHLLQHASRILNDGNTAVEAGVVSFDKGELDEGLKIYRNAVAIWPANGWAHYEIGLTLMTKQAKRLGVDLSKGISGEKPGDPPVQTDDVLAAFRESRRHDPFQWKAYQGKLDEAKPRLLALGKKVMPTWQVLLQGKSPSDAQLLAFSEGLQEVEVDDLALAARQLVVSRRGRFAPDDHPFLAISLRRVAPGAQVEDVLKLLAGDKLEVRQIVKPEPPMRPAR